MREWGVPIYDDQLLFAKLILDGAQAGLSWITILRKREAYWHLTISTPQSLHADEAKVEQLMGNAGIVRNRLKRIAAAIRMRVVIWRLWKQKAHSAIICGNLSMVGRYKMNGNNGELPHKPHCQRL